VEDLQVLAGGVQHLGGGRVEQKFEQRAGVVESQRVDAGHDVVAGHLHQAEARAVGLLAYELGVERQPGTAAQADAERLEVGGGVDEEIGHRKARCGRSSLQTATGPVRVL
jgi:hypothetical protein